MEYKLKGFIICYKIFPIKSNKGFEENLLFFLKGPFKIEY